MSPSDPTPPSGSPALRPNDHLALLTKLLDPIGAELGRRWLAALMLAPAEDRPGIVEAVERELTRTYPLEARDTADDNA